MSPERRFPRAPTELGTRQIKFLKTTAIGGLLFLLPLVVLGALIGQVVPIVLAVAAFLGEYIPVRTAAGIALLVVLALVIVLLLCFAAGLVARHSLGKRVSVAFEKNLLLLFPRYAILKDQMAGTLGGDETRPRMKAVLVRLQDTSRLGFEIERSVDGMVTVYLPGSPDPWSGNMVILDKQQVEAVNMPFGDAVATFEQLGRGSAAWIAARRSVDAAPDSTS